MSGLNSFTGRGMLNSQYQEIWTKAMRSAYKIKGISNEIRQDVVSDAVLKIITKELPASLEFGTPNYWGYIDRVVYNTFIDTTRVKKRGLGYRCDWSDESTAFVEFQNLKEQEEEEAFLQRIQEVIEGMKELLPQDKELIEKRFLLGWSYEQIVQHFEFSNKNCAGSYVKRAKDRLIKKLKSKGTIK